MREARMGLFDLDRAPRLELTAEVDQELSDLRSAAELALDSRECASSIPERAFLSRTAFRVALGDELDRAELPMLGGRLHDPTMPSPVAPTIGVAADVSAGTYGA